MDGRRSEEMVCRNTIAMLIIRATGKIQFSPGRWRVVERHYLKPADYNPDDLKDDLDQEWKWKITTIGKSFTTNFILPADRTYTIEEK